MAEWLRRLTRNQLGSARTGSNPVHCEKMLQSMIFCYKYFFPCGLPFLQFLFIESFPRDCFCIELAECYWEITSEVPILRINVSNLPRGSRSKNRSRWISTGTVSFISQNGVYESTKRSTRSSWRKKSVREQCIVQTEREKFSCKHAKETGCQWRKQKKCTTPTPCEKETTNEQTPR